MNGRVGIAHASHTFSRTNPPKTFLCDIFSRTDARPYHNLVVENYCEPLGSYGGKGHDEELLGLVRLLARAAAAEYVRGRTAGNPTPPNSSEKKSL